MPRITVSYRRDDSSAAARAIYDRLRTRYGSDSVFMDIDVVDLGEDYRKRIYQAISQTDCLLVLIGPRWLGPTGDGRNRINDANDPVRLEVERALEMGLRVVPILLENTQMPSPDDLPKALGELPFLNAGDISTGREFDNQIERIMRFIDRTFAETEPRAAKKAEPAQKTVEQKVTQPKTVTSFPMRAVAIAALAVLVCAGGAWALLNRTSTHSVAVAPASPQKSSSSHQAAPGALAISYVVGDVAVLRGDQGTPVAAVRNAPLLPGDAISTGNGGYAELHLGRGTRLFLDGGTQVRVVRAGDTGSEVQLAQGTAEMHVFKANGAQVDTPLVALVGNHPGVYALSVIGDPTVTVTALAGQATLNTQSGEQTISAVRTVVVSGSNAAASVMNDQKAPLAFNTGFSSFTATRNDAITPEFNDAGMAPAPVQQQDAPAPIQDAQAQDQPQDQPQAPEQAQAPEQIDGAEDLPSYGKWEDSDYGKAWAPNEPPQWTPYSDGQWVWEPYYGYTWVANEPWGWAPYHYGRWFYQGGVGWMWAPGAASPWAPAQVAFIQTGGIVAWLPLAPGDPYAPWWGTNRTVVYVSDVNRYHNARYPRAFAQVPIQQFRSGNFRHVTRVAYFNLHHPTVVNVTRTVAPTRANLSFSPQRPHSVASFPRQPFVGHDVAIHRTQFAPPPRPVAVGVHRSRRGTRASERFRNSTLFIRPHVRSAACTHRGLPLTSRCRKLTALFTARGLRSTPPCVRHSAQRNRM